MVDHTEKLLKNAHTRQLLPWLRRARACGGSYSPCEQAPGTHLTITALKAELATREHVPNKAESRALRQAAAKKGR